MFFKKKNIKTYLEHSVYGKIYYPYYNTSVKIDNNYIPELFKRDSQGNLIKQEIYFLRDYHLACTPYINSNYFIFDRYNFGLDTHFYSHNAMLETMGEPKRRFGLLIESESIEPEGYKIFDKHKELYKEFSSIFTYSDHILDSIPNASFFPVCAGVWYKDINVEGLTIQERMDIKNKNISIVSSNKTMCDLHKYRLDLAMTCKREHLADTYGTFDGGDLIDIKESLTNYRFSIAIENDITSYFFTEKITNCFASLTIPIYLGASKIDKFFNPDGIIRIDTKSDIKKILSVCTSEFYNERKEAIIDNYNRVQEYFCIWDYLYRHYLANNIIK